MSLSQQFADDSQTTNRFTIPAELESPTSKLVYLYLQVADEATVAQLRDDLGLSQLTLLPTIATLEKHGYLDRSRERLQVAR